MTAGVEILTGDPKKAILKMSGPMIVAMLLMSTYNLVNAIWVAGLGSDALAAIGFITPLFMVLIGLANGLGAGTASVISRRIGAKDWQGADNAAAHAILITAIISICVTAALLIFTGPLVSLFGAGKTAALAVEYGRILFLGTILILLTNVGYAILRAEGDTKRTMYVMGASSVLNMILDPILIYWAKMGIVGAAWGVIISVSIVAIVQLYWFLVKKDTYISLQRGSVWADRQTTRDILGVGLPASLEFFLFALLSIIINTMLVIQSGTDAVAVYTAGFRVVFYAIIPLIAIGTSLVSIAGAAFGARSYEKIRVAHTYAVEIGILVALATSAITWLFANQIAAIFTYTAEGAHLAPSIAAFLAVMCLFYPFIPPGLMSASVFQGVGKGMTSLFLTMLRGLVFNALFAYLFAFVLSIGEHGVWWGIVAGEVLGGIMAWIWARVYLARLIRSKSGSSGRAEG
jgi:putative MATE family efflux protein